MSKRLVRKLLQQTNELDASSNVTENQDDDDHTKRMIKKRKYAKKKESETVHDVDLVQMHIKTMLGMDRAISELGGTASQQSLLGRREEEHRIKSKRRSKLIKKKNMDGGVGNSRSSSSRNAKHKLEPTFDKKKAEAAKEKKTLEDIAKMLKKRSKGSSKKA
mmetsp:Transcript_19723/g.30412  ORF Transcript_19723/g.30412 Transcript_19723/m.30412 type:complete len:162 (-) Transcript_19723:1387-1872(-)